MTALGRLTGYVALVTGAGGGLGKAVAEYLAKENAHVVLADLETSSAQAVAETLNKMDKNPTLPRGLFCPTDVTSETDVKKTLEMCEKVYKKLNVLVNCAGVFSVKKTYDFSSNEVHSLDSFKRIIDINLVGTFNVCRLASQLMAKNNIEEFEERGVIINTSSINATDGTATQVAYCASKAGILGMTLPMAKDLSSAGIRVMTISPGPFETQALLNYTPTDSKFHFAYVYPERPGKPEEFAELVAAIVTNKMLNGGDIRIDGGVRLA